MTPIDLTLFALHSQKIPSKVLAPKKVVFKFKAIKLLAAHLIDGLTSGYVAFLLSFMYDSALRMIMVTEGLRENYPWDMTFNMAIRVTPFIMLSYFFFCYFFNHGQTYGMFLMKSRLKLKEKSLKESLKWAAHSLLMCVSFGSYYFVSKKFWNDYKNHDYLYHELLTHKEDHSINILDRADQLSDDLFEDWKMAA